MATTQKSRTATPAPASVSTPATVPASSSRRSAGLPSIPLRARTPRRSRTCVGRSSRCQRISSLGVLAGGVFHELNNALTPILAYAKLGLRNPDPAYRERALSQIVEASQRAATITRGMLA